MIKISEADMFSEELNIRVNTVNCVGVMGKGIALEFKNRYPGMFSDYLKSCKNKELYPGKLHIWSDIVDGTIINFPTKDHWRGKSQYEYIDKGLDALHDYLKNKGKISIGIPALGCGLGGLNWSIVEKKIFSKLNDLDADIYVFPPLNNKASKTLSEVSPNSLKTISTHAEVHDLCSKFGFNFIEDLYYSSTSDSLDKKLWITILASKELIDEKELKSISLIAKELKLIADTSKKQPLINIIYNNKKTENLIKIFNENSLPVNLILPFGFSTKPKILELINQFEKKLFSISSIVDPEKNWTKSNLRETLGFLQERSEIVIVSNPTFDWKYVNSPNTWKDIFAIKYSNSEIPLRINTLGIKKSTESPNLDFLKNLMESKYPEKSIDAPQYTLDLSKLPKDKWDEVFNLIKSTNCQNISFNIKDINQENIQEFIEEFKIILIS
jgi:O-acetyl-ADP-ribose deacetylase (regulator of RNase III)